MSKPSAAQLLAEAQSVLEEVEWVMGSSWAERYCPSCLNNREQGHHESCRLEPLKAKLAASNARGRI